MLFQNSGSGVRGDHLPVFADYTTVPEPTLGLALLVVAPLLRRRRR